MRFLAISLFLISLCSLSSAQGQSRSATLNGVHVLLEVSAVVSEYTSAENPLMDSVLTISRILPNGNEKLLEYTIHAESRDCNNHFTDHGWYQIKQDSLVLTTRYEQDGNDPIPSVWRSAYLMQKDGNLKLVQDTTHW